MAVAGVNALTSGSNEPAWAPPAANAVATPSAEGVVIGPSWVSGALTRHTYEPRVPSPSAAGGTGRPPVGADVRFTVNKIAQARLGA